MTTQGAPHRSRRRFVFPVLVLAAFLLGLMLRGGGGDRAPAPSDPHAATATIWTCSMHPQIRLPAPGQCPICFMDLIPLDTHTDEAAGPRTLVLSENAAALAEIRTTAVARRAVTAQVRLSGKVVADETRTRVITARVPGRIDTLFVDFTGGKVRAGAPLASLYSPQLYAAQVELLGAVRALDALAGSDDARLVAASRATIDSARERLRLWGLTDAQVRAVETRGAAAEHLVIHAPLGGVVTHKEAVEGMYVTEGARLYTVADLSRVWVELDAYESDLSRLAVGQNLSFVAAAAPGRTFTGTVVFIDPVLDARTRTAAVRLEADNRDGLLKPGLFVDARVDAAVGGDAPLVIPTSAPLITGDRAVVYVRLPDRGEPTFEGREVVLGARAGDDYVLVSGLAEGEEVVTHGSFKLDSALQIQAKPSMMSPAGDAAPPAGHGGMVMAAEPSTDGGPVAVEETVAAAPAFLAALDDVVTAYVALQSALAGDDDDAAAQAARAAAAAVRDVDMSLAGPRHEDWMADVARLTGAYDAVAKADDLAGRRARLQSLTDLLWNALRGYGYAPDRTVRRFHCPMAFGGQGGDWLQFDPVTANPYYGASMLRCGSQTDSLAVVEGGAR